MPSVDEHLVRAMGPREVIGLAVELLRKRHSTTEAAAFEMLADGYSDSQEVLREAAVATVLRFGR